MHQIRERLFVGSWKDAVQCNKNSNFEVITVANDATNNPECMGKHFFPMTDPGTESEDGVLLFKAVKKIEELMKGDKNILVHCISGVNRSPSVIIAYLMRSEKLSIADAHNVIKKVRKHINPCDHQLQNAIYATGQTTQLSRKGFEQAHLTEHEEIVHKCYLDILGRPADQDGLSHYSELMAIDVGFTEDKMRLTLLKSNEYKEKQLESDSKHGLYGKSEE